jgi:hypothetical protein
MCAPNFHLKLKFPTRDDTLIGANPISRISSVELVRDRTRGVLKLFRMPRSLAQLPSEAANQAETSLARVHRGIHNLAPSRKRMDVHFRRSHRRTSVRITTNQLQNMATHRSVRSFGFRRTKSRSVTKKLAA